MSPEQIERVRATVARLDGDGDRLAGAFLGRLGTTRPAALRLFPNGAGSLEFGLHRFAELVANLGELATWARQLGTATGEPITVADMQAVGEALVTALEDVLADRFDAEDRRAVQAGATLMAELIR